MNVVCPSSARAAYVSRSHIALSGLFTVPQITFYLFFPSPISIVALKVSMRDFFFSLDQLRC